MDGRVLHAEIGKLCLCFLSFSNYPFIITSSSFPHLHVYTLLLSLTISYHHMQIALRRALYVSTYSIFIIVCIFYVSLIQSSQALSMSELAPFSPTILSTVHRMSSQRRTSQHPGNQITIIMRRTCLALVPHSLTPPLPTPKRISRVWHCRAQT